MQQTIHKALGVITTVLVVIIAVFALLILAGKPFGIHAFTVLSGSMEPQYHTGSLIYVKETPSSQLHEGDVITFMTGKDTTATHRIVSLVSGEDGVTRFETQGDANNMPDGELVHPDNVIGVPVLQIPVLGYAINYIQYPPGLYIAISFGALVVFLMFLPDLFLKREDEDESQNINKVIYGKHARPAAYSPHTNNAPYVSQNSYETHPSTPANHPAYSAHVRRAYPQVNPYDKGVVSHTAYTPNATSTPIHANGNSQQVCRPAQQPLQHAPKTQQAAGYIPANKYTAQTVRCPHQTPKPRRHAR